MYDLLNNGIDLMTSKYDRYALSHRGFDMADLSTRKEDIDFWLTYAINMGNGEFMDEREEGKL